MNNQNFCEICDQNTGGVVCDLCWEDYEKEFLKEIEIECKEIYETIKEQHERRFKKSNR